MTQKNRFQHLPPGIALSLLCLAPALCVAGIMPPAPLPDYSAGDVFTYLESGKQSKTVVESVDGDLVHFKDPDSGTNWSYFRNFALPTPVWNSETGDPNYQFFIGDTQSFFPLRVGNVMSFAVEGSDKATSNSWNYLTRCEVTGNENITVPAGTFATYRVDCISSEWGWEKTYNYAPAEQLLVRLESRSDGEPDSIQELVSFKKVSR